MTSKGPFQPKAFYDSISSSAIHFRNNETAISIRRECCASPGFVLEAGSVVQVGAWQKEVGRMGFKKVVSF